MIVRTSLLGLLLAGALGAHAARLDLGEIDALFASAALGDGVASAVATLAATGGDAARPDGERANAWLTAAHLHWRDGQPDRALAATDKALALAETIDGTLLKARLLDAAGAPDAAAPWYEKAAAATDDDAEKEFIRLRLTMAQAGNRNVDALVKLAGARNVAFRNRAAIALALLGHADQAVALYDAAASRNPFRAHARLAHWAIAAGDLDRAQDAAWTAYASAGTRTDSLYALALWVEAYRKDDALDELLARLDADAAAGEPDENLVQTRVDVLVETEEYDDAIAFYEAQGGAAALDARRRLIQLYEAAGRTDDMVAEYEKLMAAEPAVLAWYQGLAAHYVNMAQPDAALAVWDKLAANNPQRIDVLVEAGEAMVDMGFVDEAVAMLEERMAAGAQPAGLMFLFDLRRERGERDQALAALQRLEAALTGTDTGLRDLADAYERINQPNKAIGILEALRERQGELGYDERMRLAWLYGIGGRKQDAMRAWRELWVSVDSEARRKLAESQFLLLATELNALGDLVVELEEKLILKQANRNEIGLLVRIYTEVGDLLSATEVIDEYARYSDEGEVERLRQLGHVHRMLADYSAYDGVLRKLVAADPENELEHVQNIVLNMLAHDLSEGSKGRYDGIQEWLARLRELDAEGVTGEFEAGIFSLGGFNDEAIASYRRALVAQPENSDNLLLMADLMKSAGRRDEAVALLQYAAEHADDDAAFVVAIDGIINMIGARTFGEKLTPAMRRTFGWTRRIILERIASRDSKFYLYQLLADIAQEVGATETEFVALENSLSEAGIRRPSVLRELVTLATPNSGFGGFRTGAGDAARQITHGRRLIGLRQELPPEVYINLGKVLLAEGQVEGAERAFDLIDDITGLIDVDTTKADLFLAAGYPDRALAWYARALNASRDDLSLLSRTAMLRETRGSQDVANALYERAVGNVLRGLDTRRREERPDTSPRGMFRAAQTDTSVSRDYRTYFENFAQGFLITWPDEAALAAQRTAALRARFDAELASALAAADDEGSGGRLVLADFPRLERTARFARRVAERDGDDALAAHLDASLAGRFADAVPPPRAADGGEPLLRRHLAMAQRDDDFEGAVRLARLAGDVDDLTALFRARIDAGKYREGLAYARAMLDATAFKRLTGAVAPTLKDNRESFARLIHEDHELALGIEADLGRELIATDDLLALLDDPASQAVMASPFGSLRPGTWEYLKARDDIDALLREFAATAARQQRGDFYGSFAFPDMLHDLLALELNPGQREQLATATTAYIDKLDLKTEDSLPTLVTLLLARQAHPANRTVVYELAEHGSRRAQLAIDLPARLEDIMEGTPEAALMAFLDLRRAGLRYFRGTDSGQNDRYASVRAGILDAARRGATEHDAETVRFVYEFEFPRYYREPSPADAERIATLLPAMIDHYPDDADYERQLVGALLALDRHADAEAALAALIERNPDDGILRATLYFHLVNQQKFEAALALVTDGGKDLRDPEVLEDIKAQVRTDRSGTHFLFRAVYRGAVEGGLRRWPAPVDDAIAELREALPAPPKGAGEELAKALRTLWRGADAPDPDNPWPALESATSALLGLPLAVRPNADLGFNDPYSSGSRDYTLDALLAGDAESDATTLFEAAAAEPFSAAELDLYLQALPADRRRRQSRLYELLVTAIEAAGASEARLAAAGDDLGEIGDHDFTVWMLLRARQDAPLSPGEHEAFARRVAEIEDPSRLQTLQVARLYAKAEAFEAASGYYRLLAAKLARHGEFMEAQHLAADHHEDDVIDLATLAKEVVATLSRDAALDTVHAFIAVARRADRGDHYDAYFDAFLLNALAALHAPQEVLAEAVRLSPTAATVASPLSEWAGARAVELARTYAMAGDAPKALALLKALVEPSAPPPPAEPGSALSNDRYLVSQAMDHLAVLYGLRHPSRRDEEQHLPLHDLVLRRERLFPTAAENRWPGDIEWMAAAADALVSWLDDPDVDRAAALEAAFVLAWQFAEAGEDGRAKALIEDLAEGITADAAPANLGHLALMSLRLGLPLRDDLAKQALAAGTLDADQQAQVIAGVSRVSDPSTALEVARSAADADLKPALLAVLEPLAEAAGDDAYGAHVRDRRSKAEDARRQIDEY